MSNSYRSQVPSPVFGEGTFLMFTWQGLAEIETFIGKKEWFGPALEAIDGLSISTITWLLGISLHTSDGIRMQNGVAYFPAADVNITTDVVPLILDALFLSIHGKRFLEFQTERLKLEEETAKKALEDVTANPLLGLKA
jgi:hypothetical protein